MFSTSLSTFYKNLLFSLVKSYTVKKGYRLSSAGKSLSFFTVHLPMMAFLSRAYSIVLRYYRFPGRSQALRAPVASSRKEHSLKRFIQKYMFTNLCPSVLCLLSKTKKLGCMLFPFFFLKFYDIFLVPVESFLLFSYYLSFTLVSYF
jgi:hypothetical protein